MSDMTESTHPATTRGKVRTPLQKAQNAADVAIRKSERAQARFEKSKAETVRLRDEAVALQKDAEFQSSHPLLAEEESAMAGETLAPEDDSEGSEG